MKTANSNQRKAGSSEFKQQVNSANQPLGMGSDPFADVNRKKQQRKYDAYKDRGYDDLKNLETYKARGQNSKLKEGGRYDTQDAAKASMQANNFNFGGDLSGYDGGAAGVKGFDMQDVRYLQKAGASKEAIQKHIRSLGNVHDSVRNNSQFGGTHYRGDMDKTKGIEQFDMGKGFNIWDINYLKKQGYDDKQIADYGINSGKNHGAATAKLLHGLGRLDTRAENTFGNPSSQLENTPIDVPYQNITPDLKKQQKRVDQEMNRDYFEEQVKKEDELMANSPLEYDPQKFFAKHLGMARAAADTRTGLDLSKYRSGLDFDVQALDKHIRKTPMYWGARSELQGLKTFGDTYRNARENPPSWSQPNPMKGIETPDFQEIYNRTKKDIKGIKV